MNNTAFHTITSLQYDLKHTRDRIKSFESGDEYMNVSIGKTAEFLREITEGKLRNVVVCSNKTDVLYAFREKKGDQGLKGTPVEYYVNLIVHDHDKTFYHYGTEHQDCNSHRMRYLRGAIENEKHLAWHSKMLSLMEEMNRTRENQDRKLEQSQVEDFTKRYDSIISLAEKEYYDNPPSWYYRKPDVINVDNLSEVIAALRRRKEVQE